MRVHACVYVHMYVCVRAWVYLCVHSNCYIDIALLYHRLDEYDDVRLDGSCHLFHQVNYARFTVTEPIIVSYTSDPEPTPQHNDYDYVVFVFCIVS